MEIDRLIKNLDIIMTSQDKAVDKIDKVDLTAAEELEDEFERFNKNVSYKGFLIQKR